MMNSKVLSILVFVMVILLAMGKAFTKMGFGYWTKLRTR